MVKALGPSDDKNGWDIAVKGLKGTLLWILGMPMLAALFLTAKHAVEWLKLGEWPHYSTANMFSDWGIVYPKVDWRGVQWIIDTIMTAPAAISLFGLTVVLGIVFGRLIDD